MHRPLSAAFLAASLALFTSTTDAGTPECLTQARKLLEGHDARGAAALLEDALPESTDRAGVLDLLRAAYESAARQAEAEGKTHDAEAYRENLEILNRKARPASPAPVTPNPSPVSERPNPSPVTLERMPRAEPGEAIGTGPSPASPPAPAQEAPQAKPAPVPAGAEVTAADSAFRAQHYDEARRLYAALEHEGKLPKTRRDHWAYCRWVALVKQINAKPKTPQEWAQIDAEIEAIRVLSPKNWFSDYLRNLAAERSHGVSRRASKSNKLVVRGAEPDESPLGLLAAHDPETARTPLLQVAPGPVPATQAPAPAPAVAEAQPHPEPERPAQAPKEWLSHESANFRVLHADQKLAEQVAGAAEAARHAQIKRWTGAEPAEPWAPKCDIYLYPNAAIYSERTGQPLDSPGFSTMGTNSGRVIARRVNLRVDHPNLVPAILPHEITHVVLADIFPRQQVPRWADEGMAVLAEPPSEQRLRSADLEGPLSTGKLFRLEHLMAMDYPDGRYWGLYYAQSVSLTRFLVEQGTPAQFIKFVQSAQRSGPEAALKQVYKIDGCTDLHQRWVSYASTRTKEATAQAEGGNTTRR